MLNFQTLLEVLPKAGMGWGGVFVVTVVIILAVELLNYFTGRDRRGQKSPCLRHYPAEND